MFKESNQNDFKRRAYGEDTSYSIERKEWTDSSSVSSYCSKSFNTLSDDKSFNDRANIISIPKLIRGIISGWSDLEISYFKNLFAAATVLKEPTPETMSLSETNDFRMALGLIQKRCDTKCRRIVKMTSYLDEFGQLSEDDKIVLIKGGCKDITNLLSITNFDFDGQYWTVAIVI